MKEDIIELFYHIENHLLKDEIPSIYLRKLLDEGRLDEKPFDKIKKLKTTEQNLKFHPEGNVLNHTLMVVDAARKLIDKAKDKRVVMWSALLHDIGKPLVTRVRKGRITSYDHDKVGREQCIEFLSYFNLEEDFIIKVSSMVRWHMQNLFYNKDLPFKDIETMVREVDIEDIVILSLSDRLGRGNLNSEDKDDIEKDIKSFKEYCFEVKK